VLHECANEVARNARFALIGVLRLEAAVWFEDLKQEWKRDIIQHTIGIHRDQARFNGTKVLNVAAGYIIRDATIFLVVSSSMHSVNEWPRRAARVSWRRH
jgi:hypothetical protein